MKSFKISDHLFEEIPKASYAGKLDRYFMCHTCKSLLSFSIFYSGVDPTLTVWVFCKLPFETVGINARHRAIIPCSGVKMDEALT